MIFHQLEFRFLYFSYCSDTDEYTIPILLRYYSGYDISCFLEGEVQIMYMTVREVSERWGISDRRVGLYVQKERGSRT